MRLLFASFSLLAAFSALADPIGSVIEKRQIQTLSTGAVAAFRPYSFYAASAYCDPYALKAWSCGSMWEWYSR